MVSQLKPDPQWSVKLFTDNERMDLRPHPERNGGKHDQISQVIREPPEGLGGVPVRTGDEGEEEDWDRFLIMGVPALINSISRSCFPASIKNR
jgi:hypothetical protein